MRLAKSFVAVGLWHIGSRRLVPWRAKHALAEVPAVPCLVTRGHATTRAVSVSRVRPSHCAAHHQWGGANTKGASLSLSHKTKSMMIAQQALVQRPQPPLMPSPRRAFAAGAEVGCRAWQARNMCIYIDATPPAGATTCCARHVLSLPRSLPGSSCGLPFQKRSSLLSALPVTTVCQLAGSFLAAARQLACALARHQAACSASTTCHAAPQSGWAACQARATSQCLAQAPHAPAPPCCRLQ